MCACAWSVMLIRILMTKIVHWNPYQRCRNSNEFDEFWICRREIRSRPLPSWAWLAVYCVTSRDGRCRIVYIHHSSLFLCFKVEFINVFERIYYWKVCRSRLEEIANQRNLTMEEKREGNHTGSDALPLAVAMSSLPKWRCFYSQKMKVSLAGVIVS